MRRVMSSPAAFGLIALAIVTAVAAPGFYSGSNLRDLTLTIAPLLVAAVGMTLVILLGEIDISIGAQYAVCAILAGIAAKAGMPVISVALIAMAAGAVLGLVNGVLIAQFRIPSIVVTLAAMMALRDLLRWTTEGAWIQNLPASFQWAGFGQTGGSVLIALIAAIVFATFVWGLGNLGAGRAVYAAGCSPESARLAGLDPKVISIAVFAISGMLAGLSALLGSLRFTDIQSGAGVGLEMKVIAAVVVGGASIAGGRGSLWGTLLGVVLMSTIGTSLTYLGIEAFWEKAVQGAIILAAVIANALSGSEKRLVPAVR
jgi:rhamnose transport system permease protein